MEIKEGCIEDVKWFEANILYTVEQPVGFKEWAEQITQCRYDIYLPDNTIVHAKLFIDGINKVFKDNDFTNYLVNRYEDL